SEPVTGFDASDIDLGNGVKGVFTVINASSYTLEATPTSDGSVSASVNSGAAIDLFNNASLAGSATVNSDRTAPAATVTPNGLVTNAGTVTFTFAFGEPVTGFDASDIMIANGAKGTFTALDPATYTLVVTPAAEGTVSASVPAGAAQDLAGNA